MSVAVFIRHYRRAFLHPGRVFDALILENKGLQCSVIAVSIPAVLYSLVYVFLILGGGLPFKPWLPIPPEVYYRYNVFFCAPSMFLGWGLATGAVHIVCRLLGARGLFRQTLVVFGFGISIASWSTGIHDIITSFLGAIHVIDQNHYEHLLNSPTIWRALLWLLMGIYVIWFIFLFSKGIKAVYGFGIVASIALGTLGFAVYQGFFLVFNR